MSSIGSTVKIFTNLVFDEVVKEDIQLSALHAWHIPKLHFIPMVDVQELEEKFHEETLIIKKT